MIGPMFRTTWSLTTLIAPPPWPDRTRTIAWCESLRSWVHSVAIAGLATALDTPVAIALFSPSFICPEKFVIRPERRGRLAFWSSAAAASVADLTRGSSWFWISVVILALSADWIAGSLISGEKFATYRSVLETWLAVQTPMTEMGASAQPKMMSSRATGARQLRRRRPERRAAPWAPPPESPWE